MARIVIVGAGVGGLAAAARLAAARHEVTLCERAPRCGGVVGHLSRDGFSFSTGSGVLTVPAVYRDLFLKTGDALESCVELVSVDPASRCSFASTSGGPRTVFDVPNASRSGTAAAFDAAFGTGAGADWNRLMSRAGEMWAVVRGSLIETPLLADPTERAERLRSAGGARTLRTTAPWRSLRSLARTHLRDPRLRAYLERFAADSGADPRRVPATVAVTAYLEQTFGLWYVRGGLYTMVQALVDRCTELGVRLRTDTEVATIDTATGRVDGVVLADGSRLPADVVVTDVPAEQLYGSLVPRPRELARGRRLPAPSAMLELHLALRTGDDSLPHRTLLFPDCPAAEPSPVFADHAEPPTDPLMCVLAPKDPGAAPHGGEGWTVQVRVPRHDRTGAPGTVDWTAPGLRERYAAQLLGLLTHRGVDVAPRLLWHELRTPADIGAAAGSGDGAVPGTGADGPRQAQRRVPNRSALPGLFSVGSAAHPGGGLMRVGMSAALVAELIGRA